MSAALSSFTTWCLAAAALEGDPDNFSVQCAPLRATRHYFLPSRVAYQAREFTTSSLLLCIMNLPPPSECLPPVTPKPACLMEAAGA